MVYSTYVGGSDGGSAGGGGDYANGIAIDSAGDAYIAGTAVSLNFPTTSDAFQNSNHAADGSSNAFVTEVNSFGSGLLFSTYLGGSDQGFAKAIATDTAGNAYVTGLAGAYSFPVTSGAYQTTYPGGGAIFVAKALLGSGGLGTPLGTITSLAADANPQTVGVKVTFTALVQPDSGTGVPTGTITFNVDGGAETQVPLDSTGHAGFATSTLTVGTHTIEASYSGESTYAASSASLTETITSAAGTAASIAVVSGSGQTTAYGSAFSSPLVVIPKDARGNPVPGAVVSFSGSGLGFSSATATTGSNGEASLMTTAIASGSLTATASTAGVTGKAIFFLTATKVSLMVTASNASVTYNQPIPLLTYTVTGFVNGDTSSVLSGSPAETTTATQGSPAGTYPITFTQGTLSAANYTFSFVNGTLTITVPGPAATPTFSPAAGTYTSVQSVSISDTLAGAIFYYTTNGTTPTTASTQYGGAISVGATETIEAFAVAPGYSDSAVATATYTINPPAPSFSLTSSPSSTTISPWQSTKFTFTVTPASGFDQAVSFACSGLPPGDTCSFSPLTVTPAGAVVSSVMTIASTASATASASRSRPWQKAGAGFALALLLWPFGRCNHRARIAMLILLVGAFALAGCVRTPISHGYTVSVTASGGGITQASSVSLTVTQ